MKLEAPQNLNYCATVVEIKNIIPLAGCDFVVGTSIMGNHVITGKDTKIGDVGLYFPVETQLSAKYIAINNLYKDATLNDDTRKKGYFELNGRIKCVKFRGFPSEGLFMPLDSISPFTAPVNTILKLEDSFDFIGKEEICRKYIPKSSKQPSTQIPGKKGKGRLARESKLIANQFRFHDDTSQLYRNLHMIHPEDLISITYKIHGTSFIASNILCKKPLKWYERALSKLGINVVDTLYDNIYSSRKVIKNEDLHPDAQHYYSEDIWGIANNEVKPFLQEGMTIYGEAAGFLPGGGYIQNAFDFGCKPGEHKLFIYRVTMTNTQGKVFEYSMRQVQEFCKKNGLNAVPLMYYGTVENFMREPFELQMAKSIFGSDKLITYAPKEFNAEDFLALIKKRYNEKDCYICKNPKTPEEGAVIRIENNDLQAYKVKSFRFLNKESENMDKNIIDIESGN